MPALMSACRRGARRLDVPHVAAARALGPADHAEAVAAFTDAMALGLRVVAVLVLLAAVVVARGTGRPS